MEMLNIAGEIAAAEDLVSRTTEPAPQVRAMEPKMRRIGEHKPVRDKVGT